MENIAFPLGFQFHLESAESDLEGRSDGRDGRCQ